MVQTKKLANGKMAILRWSTLSGCIQYVNLALSTVSKKQCLPLQTVRHYHDASPSVVNMRLIIHLDLKMAQHSMAETLERQSFTKQES